MNRGLIVLLLVCSVAAAMVPRHKRALNTEEEEQEEALRVMKGSDKVIICEPGTPCKWSLYNGFSGLTIRNTYCICSGELVCKKTTFDTSTNSDVYRCREPDPEDETTTTEASETTTTEDS